MVLPLIIIIKAYLSDRKWKTNEVWPVLFNNIGNIYYVQNDYENAIKYHTRSLAIKEEMGDKKGIASSLNNLGINYFENGDYALASNYHRRSLVLKEEMGDRNGVANSLFNLGNIHKAEERYDSAINYLSKSLTIREELGDKNGIAQCFNMLGVIYEILGNQGLATNYNLKSLKLAQDAGAVIQIRDAAHALYTSYKAAGQTELSLNMFELYVSTRDSILSENNQRDLIRQEFKYEYEKQAIADSIKNLQAIQMQEVQLDAEIAKRDAELEKRDFQNTVFIWILVITIPMVILLLILLKKNRKANAELIQSNAEIKQARNLLLRSEKMASLGVLSAGVGHEINNPLNYIENGMKVINGQIKEEFGGSVSEKFEKSMAVVNLGVERISKIVKSMSAFSRGSVSHLETCDVADIIENCLVILSNKLRNVRVVKAFSEGGMKIEGNEEKLHQVFMNLILNASQAIYGSGEINISSEREGEHLRISLKDTGVGISEENLLKVSDPFFTTKPPGEGTGLGLFIAFNAIEEHGGTIELKSTPKIGTEFIIKLPVKQLVSS